MQERRKYNRNRREQTAELHANDGTAHPCKIVDQSPDGLMVVFNDRLAPSSDEVIVVFGRARCRCRVVWQSKCQDGTAVGLQIITRQSNSTIAKWALCAAAALLVGVFAGYTWQY